jgi:hypothetical protein
MHDDEIRKGVFVNRRDWGSYLAALQNAATYPKVMEAVRSGQAWFSDGAAQASTWLIGRESLREKFSAG